MGMDFVALMKYAGPSDRVLHALDGLEADSPPEVKALPDLFREQGFVIGDREDTFWEYHHRPDLHDRRLDRRPLLPNLAVALHMKEDFFLTFGVDAVEVYSLLRWRCFLTEPRLQRAMLTACSRFAHLFGASECIVTSDYHPAVHAFRAGQAFDDALAAAGPEDGEHACLADLYLEQPEDYVLREVERPGGGTRMQYQDWNRDQAPPEGWERASTWDSKGYWRFPLNDGQYGPTAPWSVPTLTSRRHRGVVLLGEEQWATSDDPQAMLETLLRQDEVSTRKVRLWACACVRRIWPLLVHDNSRRAVEAAERFVDGQARQQEVDHWAKAASSVRRGNRRANQAAELTARLCSALSAASQLYRSTLEFPPGNIAEAAVEAVAGHDNQLASQTLERKEQAHLLRDIFGPIPSRPVSLDPSWRTFTVMALAQAIYESRDLPSGRLDVTRLRVLADALLDAGCDDESIMRHLGEQQVHVRGCWLIDLLLSRK